MSATFDRSAARAYVRLRQDAARWVVPEGFADAELIDGLTIARLLRRHRQFRVNVWLRLGQWAHGSPVRGLTWFCEQRMGGYGLDIPPSSEIEGGFYVAHPAGVAVTTAHIGRDVTIVANATVGIRGAGPGPSIGDRVYVGAGARIIGSIHVGDGARVGANAVVLHDVADDSTVVGIPAHPVVRS